MTDYLNNKNIDDAVNAVREMKAPKYFLSEMLNKIVVQSLDRSDEDKEQASALIHALCTEGLVAGENLMQVSVVVFKSDQYTLFISSLSGLFCTLIFFFFF